MFNDWLPFAIYGLFALVIPATMMIGSFVFATRPHRARPRAHDPVRVGRLAGAAEAAALHRQLLPDGDALHPLRHRDRLPLPARGDPARARLVRVLRVPDLPDHPAASPTSTSGGRGRSSGGRRSALRDSRAASPSGCSGRRRARRKFEDEVADLEQKVGLTTLAKAVAWAQTNSMWPDTFGLACCAIEMMSIVASRYDIARFGMEAFRGSPRQADLLIVSGRVSHKMAAPLRQIYDQMLEPKWVIAMGACASARAGCSTTTRSSSRSTRSSPVDIYVPGCPPRPEQLMEGIIRLHEAVRPACRPPTRCGASRRERASTALPGPGRGRSRRHGETTLVVELERLVEAAHAPARRGGLQLPLRRHRGRLPRLGRQGRLRLHRHRRRPRPQPPDDAGLPGAAARRSRSASRSTTTCSSVSRRARAALRLQTWVDDGEPVPSVVARLADRRLARARGLGHDGHRLRGPPEPAADPAWTTTGKGTRCARTTRSAASRSASRGRSRWRRAPTTLAQRRSTRARASRIRSRRC